jgi:hypothetical protein
VTGMASECHESSFNRATRKFPAMCNSSAYFTSFRGFR